MNISTEIITGILGFTGAFIIKEFWDAFKSQKDKKESHVDEALKSTTQAVNDLKIAIVELKVRIDHLSEKLAPIPKLTSDINHAHEKIRTIEKTVMNGD